MHLEHENLLAPMLNGGVGLCRLHIILVFSADRIVCKILVSTELAATGPGRYFSVCPSALGDAAHCLPAKKIESK